MKKGLVCLCLIMLSVCFICGCGREYSYGKIERDASLTGGDLSFSYDSSSHTATFGGKGEVVSFYSEDEFGNPAGNKIGFKVFAPCDIKDFSKAKLSFQGTDYTAGSFMQTVYEQQTNYFVLTPYVNKDTTQFDVKVTWAQGAKEQVYHIKIAEGTRFANA